MAPIYNSLSKFPDIDYAGYLDDGTIFYWNFRNNHKRVIWLIDDAIIRGERSGFLSCVNLFMSKEKHDKHDMVLLIMNATVLEMCAHKLWRNGKQCH